MEAGGLDVEAERWLKREFREELCLERGSIGEVIGMLDVTDGFKRFENRRRRNFIGRFRDFRSVRK